MKFKLPNIFKSKKQPNIEVFANNLNEVLSQAEKELEKATEAIQVSKIHFTIHERIKSFIWVKKYECHKNIHTYLYANKKFCDLFFGLTHLSPEDQQRRIKGSTDIELLNDYRKRIGPHSYGELCVSTDEHTKDVGIEQIRQGKKPFACTYYEKGVINGVPLIIEVQKIPLFDEFRIKDPECIGCKELFGYCGSIGVALNKTPFWGHIETNKLVEEGKLKELVRDTVWWLMPTDNNEWRELEVKK